MSTFKVFDIAGSGMSAQSVRLNTVASNLANADSLSGDPNNVYRAKHPVFQAVHAALHAGARAADSASAVRVSQIVQSNEPTTREYLVILPGTPDKLGAPVQVQVAHPAPAHIDRRL